MRLLWGSLALLLVFSRTGHAQTADAATVHRAPAAIAAVTRVEGTPLLVSSDASQRPIVSGESLDAGARIETDATSRVELSFSGGGVVRTGGDTTIELGGEAAVGPEGEQTLQVMLRQGRIWANLSRRSVKSAFNVLTPDILLRGAGSVFSVAVSQDREVEVKTYTGQVTASGPFEIELENSCYTVHAPAGENQIAVSASWRHQIEAYRKLLVVASGAATPPFRFAAVPDRTDWVLWNEERDKE